MTARNPRLLSTARNFEFAHAAWILSGQAIANLRGQPSNALADFRAGDSYPLPSTLRRNGKGLSLCSRRYRLAALSPKAAISPVEPSICRAHGHFCAHKRRALHDTRRRARKRLCSHKRRAIHNIDRRARRHLCSHTRRLVRMLLDVLQRRYGCGRRLRGDP
jgi:hypothetical protein